MAKVQQKVQNELPHEIKAQSMESLVHIMEEDMKENQVKEKDSSISMLFESQSGKFMIEARFNLELIGKMGHCLLLSPVPKLFW